SRCRILHFQPLSDDQVRAILRDHHPGMEPHTLEFLVRAARGVPGRALSIAELDLGAVDAAFAEIARSGDPDNGKRCVLATQFAAKSAQARYEALLRRAPVFLAETACAQKGRALARTLAAYEQVSQLAASARVHNLDPQSAVFEIGSIIAGLAN
ncbi:MAG: DNA polymerase III subunit delta', partial [Alphaproteobacteria bacterium]|nr:DNA polymerase III subunit delta' [Alphaproteobacteria bacterium]